MDFTLPEELQLLRRTVRRFVDEELIPLESRLENPEVIPPEVRQHLEAKVKEIGFWAAAVPEAFGGGGIGVLGNVVLREQVCRSIVGDARDDRGFGGSPWPTLYFASPEQRQRFLEPIVRGEQRHFFGMTEPGAGNDANGIRTTAVRDGDEWVINGAKAFITGVELSDFGVVFAMTDQSKRSRSGLSAFFVEKSRPGFSVTRTTRTIGAATISELRFDQLRVPNDNLLGEVGGAMELAARTLTITRLMQAPISLGLAQRALEMATAYAQQRVTFGKPLAERGAVQQMLVDSAAELRAARLMTYQVAWRLDQGEEPRHEAALVKVYAGEVGSRILDRAIQIHGGAGVTRDLPLERMFRDQRSFRITEGGTEVQRWVIARNLLREHCPPPAPRNSH